MIYFAQINNKWATSTLIISIIKMFKFSRIHYLGKKFGKESKKPFEIFRNISFFIRNLQK
jgi:hypothetical protein